ncbi:hypothetical protein A8924_7353 [Saccharopolyspora erythraea NRRL 2338]|uniref:Uncharacterized protein n=2 Tax=Saccharopolyspora erythraea TaxID=1836 RepID=A4FQ29_SACEN|nr:hypothetical protein [Saccharopolyspora erythraea]EQD84404.1 hypothetical protein N599_20415 [Saccharopolyspora erythraea D]PFG99799.1 hypothetical protein A8924_7353 [Saccharopolyspora erythraea NRRL 2338]QRK89669.1 hypothetical protein JQX30_35000 [Saccharopolyspora erythraea]QUH05332.1 hypothetical protein HUO13_35195 [Saccharopolyspora erythraea]CAM06154.1 hypothetical protein SACE_6992 [Saccharopolyspora erythraea NRRL 2338]
MNAFPIEFPLRDESNRRRSAEAAAQADIERALREGGRLRPVWLDRFANWWAMAVRELRPGAAVDPGPAPRGCLN